MFQRELYILCSTFESNNKRYVAKCQLVNPTDETICPTSLKTSAQRRQ